MTAAHTARRMQRGLRLQLHLIHTNPTPNIMATAPTTTAQKIDLIGSIMAFEDGQMNESEVVDFFQHLIDTGLAWTLQGSYGQMAACLIEAGHCTARA